MKNVWEAPQAIPEQRFPFRHYLVPDRKAKNASNFNRLGLKK